MTPVEVCRRLFKAMKVSRDLLSPEWERLTRNAKSPTAGHCYVAAEAAFHALGGYEAGLTPHVAKLPDGGTHWWLKGPKGIIDPTLHQYTSEGLKPEYHLGRACGFLTKRPSRRAVELMRRADLL